MTSSREMSSLQLRVRLAIAVVALLGFVPAIFQIARLGSVPAVTVIDPTSPTWQAWLAISIVLALNSVVLGFIAITGRIPFHSHRNEDRKRDNGPI
jgi:hypothetical protein